MRQNDKTAGLSAGAQRVACVAVNFAVGVTFVYHIVQCGLRVVGHKVVQTKLLAVERIEFVCGWFAGVATVLADRRQTVELLQSVLVVVERPAKLELGRIGVHLAVQLHQFVLVDHQHLRFVGSTHGRNCGEVLEKKMCRNKGNKSDLIQAKLIKNTHI